MNVLKADDAFILPYDPERKECKLAIDLACELLPDVVLMDINMPVMNGIEATRILRAEAPGISVIALSMYEHVEQAQPMLDAGAVGYVCKTEAPEVLLAAIRACVVSEAGSR